MESGQSLPMSHLTLNRHLDCRVGMSSNTKREASPVKVASGRFQIFTTMSKGRWQNFSTVCLSPNTVVSMHFLPTSNLVWRRQPKLLMERFSRSSGLNLQKPSPKEATGKHR